MGMRDFHGMMEMLIKLHCDSDVQLCNALRIVELYT